MEEAKQCASPRSEAQQNATKPSQAQLLACSLPTIDEPCDEPPRDDCAPPARVVVDGRGEGPRRDAAATDDRFPGSIAAADAFFESDPRQLEDHLGRPARRGRVAAPPRGATWMFGGWVDGDAARSPAGGGAVVAGGSRCLRRRSETEARERVG